MKLTNKQFGIAGVVFLIAAIGMRSFKEPTPLVEGKPIEFYMEQLQDLDSGTQLEALRKIEVFGAYAYEAFPALMELSSTTKDEYVLNSIAKIATKFPPEESAQALQKLFLSTLQSSSSISASIFQNLLKTIGPDQGAVLLKQACADDLSKVRPLLGAFEIFDTYQSRNALTDIAEWIFSQPTPYADEETKRVKNIMAGFLAYEPSNIRLLIIPEEERQVLRQRLLKAAESGVAIDHGDTEINEVLEDVIKSIDPARGTATAITKLGKLAIEGDIQTLSGSLNNLLQQFESLKIKVEANEDKEASLKLQTTIMNGIIDAAKNTPSNDRKALVLANLLKIVSAETQPQVDLSPIYQYASELIEKDNGERANSVVRYLALDGFSRGMLSTEKYFEPVIQSIMSGTMPQDEIKGIMLALFAIAQNGKTNYTYASEFVTKFAPQLSYWESTEVSKWIVDFSNNEDLSKNDQYALLTLVRSTFPNTTASNNADQRLFSLFSAGSLSYEMMRSYIITRLSEPGGSYASVNPWYSILKSATGENESSSSIPPLEVYALCKEAYAISQDARARNLLDATIKKIERQRNIDPAKVSERLVEAVNKAKTPEIRKEALRTLILSTPQNDRKKLIPLAEKVSKEETDMGLRAAALKFIDSVDPTLARVPVLVGGKTLLLRSWDNVRYDMSKLAKSTMRAQPGAGFIVHDRSVHSRFNSLYLGENDAITSEIIYLNELGIVECASSLSGKKSREKLCEDPSQYQLFVGPGTIQAFGIKSGDQISLDFKLLEAIRNVSWNFLTE